MGPVFEFKWNGWTLTATIIENSDDGFIFDMVSDEAAADVCASLSISIEELVDKVADTLQRQFEDFEKIYYYDPPEV